MCISAYWGINIGKRDGTIIIEGVLDEDLDNNDKTKITDTSKYILNTILHEYGM